MALFHTKSYALNYSLSNSFRPQRLVHTIPVLISIFSLFSFSSNILADNFSSLGNFSSALTADKLGVIVNDADPLSVKIGEYYQQQRKIPKKNMIHIRFNPQQKVLDVTKFKSIKRKVDNLTPKKIQAYALTWAQPYRVGCMSITTAFTAGFDESFCATGCKKTKKSPYYDSNSTQPFKDFKWRPTMALAGETFADVKALIDRGIAADYSHPKGTAYLLKTADIARSARSVFFLNITKKYKKLWQTKVLRQNTLFNKSDVMFYFTGRDRVEKILTNKFLPGAIADHLTSAGGVLINSPQMSSLEWLKGGATGSYGAVTEPCNYVQKFPNPGVVMHHYIRGNSLIEAYWKSVAWPGQGIFIGEPLAKPFAQKFTSLKSNKKKND